MLDALRLLAEDPRELSRHYVPKAGQNINESETRFGYALLALPSHIHAHRFALYNASE